MGMTYSLSVTPVIWERVSRHTERCGGDSDSDYKRDYKSAERLTSFILKKVNEAYEAGFADARGGKGLTKYRGE
jgi:hypothetical protein